MKMIVRKSSVFPASRETVFEKLQHLEALRYIAKPYATFEPIGEAVSTWTVGSTSAYRFRLFGVIPYGTHKIHILRFDPDGAIASSYVLLAAEQYNVGACWVHIRNRTGKRKSSDEEIRELLGVPEGYAVLNLVALGGKGEQKRGYTEGDFDKSKIHFERY
jgi:nitroreductase